MNWLKTRTGIVGLLLLAIVGATSYGDWLNYMWRLRLMNLGQKPVIEIAADNDPFKLLRQEIAALNPREHLGDNNLIIFANDGSDLPTPARIQTFFIAYPIMPRLLNNQDQQFIKNANQLPTGGLVISQRALDLPTNTFEAVGGQDLFIYQRR